MKIGVNVDKASFYAGYPLEPDLFRMAYRVDLAHGCQTTTTAPYDQANGCFTLADPNFPEGTYVTPNGFLDGNVAEFMQVRVRLGATTCVLNCHKTAGSPYLHVDGGDGNWNALDKSTLDTGTILDGARNHWRNESTVLANQAFNGEYVRGDGRGTNYPAGLKTGQSFFVNVFDQSSRLRLPAGTWTVTAKGKGTVRVTGGTRDGSAGFDFTVSFVGGAPTSGDGTFTVPSGETNTVNFELLASDPSTPLYDARLIMPGSWPSDGTSYAGKSFVQIYAENASNPAFRLPHPDVIADLRRCTHARWGDFLGIINIFANTFVGLRDEADRALPYQGLGDIIGNACCWEYVFEATRLSGADAFIPVAHESSDAATLALIQKFKAGTGPRDRLMLADSIEVWNDGFVESGYAKCAGSARFHPRAVDSITFDSGTGRATAHRAKHRFHVGDSIWIGCWTDPAYSGTMTVEAITADTFTFVPFGTPADATAVPWRDSKHGVFKVGEGYTTSATSIAWKWATTENFHYFYSGFVVVAPGVGDGQVVVVSGCAQPGVDGAYVVTRPNGLATDEVLLGFQGSGYHRPLLPATKTFPTYAPLSGQQIRIAVVGTTDATASTISSGLAQPRYHGYRSAHNFQIAQSVFPDQLDRLCLVVDGWIGGAYNELSASEALATFGGHWPPGSERLFTFASYHDSFTQDQEAQYCGAGQFRGIDEPVVSGGVASVTCAERPTDWSQAWNPTGARTRNHGWSTGDSILIQNAALGDGTSPGTPVAFRATITVTGPTTFTFPVPAGIPDGTLHYLYGSPGMYAIRGRPKGVVVFSATSDGAGHATLTAPGHPWGVGDHVRLGHTYSDLHEAEFVVTAVTSTTFTIATPGIDFAPTAYSPGVTTMCAYDAGLLPLFSDAILARLSEAEYVGWFDNVEGIRARYDIPIGTYETGLQTGVGGSVGRALYVGCCLKASTQDPAWEAVEVACMAMHANRGHSRYTYYNLAAPWSDGGGGFGLKEFQQDARSRRWPGFLDGIDQFGTFAPTPGTATGFTLTMPNPSRLDQDPGYIAVGPNGALSAPATVTLTGPGGISFSPSSLTFAAGDTAARLVRPTPSTATSYAVTATPASGPGSPVTASFVVLDEDGNDGATLLGSDSFDRSDGSSFDPFVANHSDCAAIVANHLRMTPTAGSFNAGLFYFGGSSGPVLDAQVRFVLVPDTDGSTSTGGPSAIFRSNGQLGGSAQNYTVAFRTDNGHVYIFASAPGHGDVGGGAAGMGYDFFLSPNFDTTHRLLFLAKCRGTPATFDIKVTDLTTGDVLLDQSGLAPAFGFDVDDPGYAGIALNGYASYPDNGNTFDDVRVSSLAAVTSTATRLDLSGPATAVVGVASADYTATPVGGTLAADTTATPTATGVAFTPSTLAWLAGQGGPKTFKATGSVAGLKSISLPTSPQLGTAPTASTTFTSGTPTPTLAASPTTATAGNGVDTVSITATRANSTATLAASVSGGGTLSTSAPTSGTPFTWTKPGSGSGTATVTVTDATDSLSATCVITYTATTQGTLYVAVTLN